MATIAAVIRWADNTDTLKRNLKEGLNQIEAVRASAEKMVQSLSGERLISAAHRSVAAITQIGGATKLTAQEAQRNFTLIDKAMEKLALTGKTIPDDMRRMRDELEKVANPTDSLTIKVGQLAAAFAAMIALAVVNWFRQGIQEGLRYGDMLVGLRAKTDLSIRDLQILEDIGIDANVSIETLARGVQMLQERLANGAAHKGIREIGLSIDALRAMSPGEMFAAIGSEIAKIEDPIRRAEAASKIFGRSWREIIPALRADMAQAAASAKIVGDAQVEAADRAIDRWNKFWNDQKRGWTEWAGNVILNWEKVNAAKAKLDSFGAVPALPAAPQSRIGLGNIVNDVDPERLERISQAQLDAIDKQVAATKKAADEQARWNEQVRQFSGPAKGFETDLALMHFKMGQLSDATLEADQRAIGLLGTLKQFTDVQIPELPSRQIGDGLGRGPATLPSKTFDDENISDAATKTEKLLGYLSSVDQILSGINAKWAQMATVAVRAVGAVITKLMEGDWIGAIVAGVAGVIGVFGELFGITEESQRVSPMRDEFFKMAGGLEKLNPQVQALTGNLKLVQAVFDAKTVKDYEAAVAAVNEVLRVQHERILTANDLLGKTRDRISTITVMSPALKSALDNAMKAQSVGDLLKSLKDINTELDEQQQRFDDIRGTLAKYKIPETEAGDPLFKTQVINERAQELRKDYENIRKSGVDINVAMRAMGPSINAFVQSAIKMGVEVPESMREVIQVAMDAGEIFDENGKKITVMDQLGLKFGPTMETTMATVASVMERLMLVLEGLATFFGVTLPGAAEDGAAGVQAALDGIEAPELTIRTKYDLPEGGFPTGGYTNVYDSAALGGLVTERGIQHFASGGRVLRFVPRGIDTVPAMLAVGEGVVNRSGMGVLGADGLSELNRGRGLDAGDRIGDTRARIGKVVIQAGMFVHEHDLKDILANLSLDGIEKGGKTFGKFRKLLRQAS